MSSHMNCLATALGKDVKLQHEAFLGISVSSGRKDDPGYLHGSLRCDLTSRVLFSMDLSSTCRSLDGEHVSHYAVLERHASATQSVWQVSKRLLGPYQIKLLENTAEEF